MADEGLFRLKNNQFEKIELKDEKGIDIGKYFGKGCEIDNKLFIVTDPAIAFYPSPSYLIVYDLATGKACISKKPPEIYAVAESPQKDILAATSDGVKKIDKDKLRQGIIAFTSLPAKYQSVQNKIANYLYFDREQNLWLTLSEGICKIDPHGATKIFSVGNGLPVNLHYSIFQDKERIMWFVNEQTGISKLSNEQVEFYTQVRPGFSASDLYADSRSDTVWFVDQVQKKLLSISPDGSKEFLISNSSRWLSRFIPGTNKNYLAGDFEIYQYDNTNAGTAVNPRLVYSFRDSVHGVPMVNNSLPDDHGNLLFTNDKINVVLGDRQLVSYPLGYFADQFVMDSNNHLWAITRQNKLFLFQLHPGNASRYFEFLKLYTKEVPGGPRSIALDKQGNLWIGTRTLGLFCFSVDEKFGLTLRSHVDTKTGLSDNCIINLHADQEGNVWACSPVGLDKLQLKNNKWVVENITRGNNIYQNVVKVQTTRSGEHWVLTSAGIIRIGPAAVTAPPVNFKASILFTEIKAGKDTLDLLVKKPAFSYRKNDLFFQWAVPSFVDEKQIRFSYKLQGSTANDWSEPSPDAMVRFVNLAPGKYVLHIKAIFPNGLYPETGAVYSFEILAPWWQTWWFRVLVIIAAGVGVALLVRSYVRRKLEKQRLLLEKRQAIEKERSRIASDMHDDLGAGLSTIRFLSEKVKRNPATDVTKKEIEKIAGISVELVENMNEIIWAMNEKNDTLEDLLFYTRSYAKEYCEENQLHCAVDFPENIPPVFVSGELRRNIFLTVKESLHNIVKYAGATQVEFGIRIDDDHLTVIIKDNGRGLAPAHTGATSGGNGLRNMRRRIESIGGNFVLLNGMGVTIEMRVPLNRASLGH